MKLKKGYHSQYKAFRSEFIRKQILVLIAIFIAGAVYSLVAPFVISSAHIMEFTMAHREFRPLLFGSLIALAIDSFIFLNKRIWNDEKKRKVVDYIVDFVTLFFCAFIFFFADRAYIYSYRLNEISNPLVFVSCSLVVAALIYVPPMIFGIFYLIECAIFMWEIVAMGGGWSANSTLIYNLFFFMVLVILIVNIRYGLGLRNFVQQKQIERMQAESEKFMASVTHEMRTPLNSVLGKNELIRRETKEPETARLTKEINSSGKLLLSLINDILDLSKIRAGKMNIVPADYRFMDVYEEIQSIMKSEAEGHGLAFCAESVGNIPAVMNGDEVRLKQIVLNLLSNAIKYTREGTVTLRVVNKSEAEGKILLRVEVEDTGIGIREEDLPKLMSEFVRVDENKNRTTQGTGLGLSITASLLHLMDSELKVESEYGKGSKFYFDIEQIVVDETAYDTVDNTVEEVISLPDLKVLIVDDNRVNYTVAKGLMRYYHFVPAYAPSGEACLKLLEGNRYDLIFIDHMMPEMDGVETLCEIKRRYPSVMEKTPIIALTANNSSDAKECYQKLGFSDFLAKPINPKQLDQLMRSFKSNK